MKCSKGEAELRGACEDGKGEREKQKGKDGRFARSKRSAGLSTQYRYGGKEAWKKRTTDLQQHCVTIVLRAAKEQIVVNRERYVDG